MVYRKNNFRVLLGPKILQFPDEDGTVSHVPDDDRQALRITVRKPVVENQAFEKCDTNIYKRTRHFQTLVNRPKLEKYSTALELSGHKVEKDDPEIAKSTKLKCSVTTTNINDTGVKTEESNKLPQRNCMPSKVRELQSASDIRFINSSTVKAARGNFSAGTVISILPHFLTDFVIRSERTDAFPGHSRCRDVASANLERQMVEKAERHIRMCQTVGNMKRSSKALYNYQGLRNAVSPHATPNTFRQSDRTSKSLLREKSYVSSDSSVDKISVVPYVIQIRKNAGSLCRMKSIHQACQANDPLPEISGRTMLVGFGCTV